MTNDTRDLSIDELELSVRGYELLSTLGVTTVGMLLDRATIEIPIDWPRKIARLVGAEIRMACEELAVPYQGTIVVPPAVPAAHRATGTVAERWSTITTWLGENHPAALAHWNEPASADAIAATERALGVALPDDYRQFLALANGQKELAPMVGLGWLLRVEELTDARENIFGEATPVDPHNVGPGVRALDYAEGWIPISQSARGRDFTCLDLDPAPGGTVGQIIEYVVDSNARPLVAASFADFLARYFEEIHTGEIDLDDFDDVEDTDSDD